MIIVLLAVGLFGYMLYSLLQGTSWRDLTGAGKAVAIALVFFIAIACFVGVALSAENRDNRKSDSGRWDSLSEEEKEWYHDNYGDGQYDDIQDAISDYENNN